MFFLFDFFGFIYTDCVTLDPVFFVDFVRAEEGRVLPFKIVDFFDVEKTLAVEGRRFFVDVSVMGNETDFDRLFKLCWSMLDP